ncbi:hypothetical protein AUQ37_07985 [Candidatus Methanomethylophilus sp. 1R26]|nr:hypothetical protein AUQ37_07985 [Candidatus Methanomethylophilus sp. 1R26]
MLIEAPIRRYHELAVADDQGGASGGPGLDACIPLLHAVDYLLRHPVYDHRLLDRTGDREGLELHVRQAQRDLLQERLARTGYGDPGLADQDEPPLGELLEDAAHAALADAHLRRQALAAHRPPVREYVEGIVDVRVGKAEHRTVGRNIHDFHVNVGLLGPNGPDMMDDAAVGAVIIISL